MCNSCVQTFCGQSGKKQQFELILQVKLLMCWISWWMLS